MEPIRIISKFYDSDSLAFYLLVEHSSMVVRKSLEVAAKVKHLYPDKSFIEEAAMLHDIGIFLTEAPGLGCFGEEDYVCHGFLGREILEKEGFPLHGLVCERHVGVGLSIKDIAEQGLPLPQRDMFPLTLEEKIICYADKFFSKKMHDLEREKSIGEVRAEIQKYGVDKLIIFEELHAFFNK